MADQEFSRPARPTSTEKTPAPVEEDDFGLLGNDFMQELTAESESDDACGYTVQPGDTLWGISQRSGGSGKDWPAIYERNRGVVGEDPNLIHPGQVLNLCDPSPTVVQDPTAPSTAGPVEEAPAPVLSDDQTAAVDVAATLLTETHFFDWVTDEDAVSATAILTALPAELQGQAIGRLDDTQFDNLLTELPLRDRASFEHLWENVTDPERKLRLWAEYQRATAANQAEDNREDVSFWDRLDGEESDAEYRNSMRDRIAENSSAEIDEEVAHLMQLAKDGEPLTVEAIEELAARKARELEMETRHGLVITNSTGWEAQGNRPALDRRVWSLAELDEMEEAFARMPDDHLSYNREVQELQRVQVKMVEKSDGTWDTRNSVGGDHSDAEHRVRVFDHGASTTGATWRTDRDSELAGHDTDPTSLLQEVVTHEVGHAMESLSPELEAKWRSISSWQDWNDAGLRAHLAAGGMSQADIDQFVIDVANGDQEFGGSTFRTNHYGGITSHDTGALPMHDTGDMANDSEWSMADSSEWHYAGETQGEHFAETYAKALHAPEALYEDLVSQPQQALVRASSAVQSAQSNLDSLVGSGAPQVQIDEAQRVLDAAKTNRIEAQDTVSDRQAQWDFMRTDVFGVTNQTVTDAATTLREAGGDMDPTMLEAVIADFQSTAGHAATPDQIERLRQRTLREIEAGGACVVP